MPDPDKKISTPTLDSCDRNVVCLSGKTSAENSKPEVKTPIKECVNPCAKEKGTGSAKPSKNKNTSAKESKSGSSTAKPPAAKPATVKPTTECKTTVKEKQAVLNKEPCGPGPTCQLARPESTNAKARLDKTKPSCIDYESCEEEEEAETEAATVEKQASGCINYENCRDLENEEKRRLKQQKEMEKQKKKEKTQKGKEETPCFKK